MTAEELAGGFCIGNSNVTKVEIPVFTVPNWLKWGSLVGLGCLIYFGVKYHLKSVKEKANLAEINRLKQLNQEQVIAQIAIEQKLSRYEPK